MSQPISLLIRPNNPVRAELVEALPFFLYRLTQPAE